METGQSLVCNDIVHVGFIAFSLTISVVNMFSGFRKVLIAFIMEVSGGYSFS